MAKYTSGEMFQPEHADVAIPAEPVKALGQRPGTADLGVGGDRPDRRSARDPPWPSGRARCRPPAPRPRGRPGRTPRLGGLHDRHRQGHGRNLLDGRCRTRCAAGTDPPSSTSTTGPVTATVSSAIPPKTVRVTTRSSPSAETAVPPVRTGACSLAATAPSSTRSVGPMRPSTTPGCRDDVGNRGRVGLHRCVTRLAEPDHPVDAAGGDRLRDRRGPTTTAVTCPPSDRAVVIRVPIAGSPATTIHVFTVISVRRLHLASLGVVYPPSPCARV